MSLWRKNIFAVCHFFSGFEDFGDFTRPRSVSDYSFKSLPNPLAALASAKTLPRSLPVTPRLVPPCVDIFPLLPSPRVPNHSSPVTTNPFDPLPHRASSNDASITHQNSQTASNLPRDHTARLHSVDHVQDDSSHPINVQQIVPTSESHRQSKPSCEIPHIPTFRPVFAKISATDEDLSTSRPPVRSRLQRSLSRSISPVRHRRKTQQRSEDAEKLELDRLAFEVCFTRYSANRARNWVQFAISDHCAETQTRNTFTTHALAHDTTPHTYVQITHKY